MTSNFLAVVTILVMSILNTVVKSQKPSDYPVFLGPVPFQFNVSELQNNGYLIGNMDATRSYFMLPCFSIKTETNKFRITACDQTDNANIYLTGTLDYETKKSYVLKIVAVDFFNTSLITTKDLTIAVINENEERPQFKNKGFDLNTISEAKKVGTKLSDLIVVTDIDGEANANNLTVECDAKFQLACAFFDVVQNNIPNKNDWKGNLLLKRNLTLKEYKIKLDATDGKYTTSIVFTIPVRDLNTHPPKFIDAPIRIDINEETAAGTNISPVIVVTDQDTSDGNIEVNCISKGDNSMKNPCTIFGIKKLTGSSSNKWFGIVVLKKKLDFETYNKPFVFQLLTTDGKNENKHNITITLEDSNDEPPFFVPNSREWRIRENAKPGTSLQGDLEVSDMDKSPVFSKVQITCDITNGVEYIESCNTFGLNTLVKSEKTNSWRAQLVLKKTLDYETRKAYSIRFKATDGKSNSYLERKIYVLDVNDNAPSFASNLYNATLAMSTPQDTLFEPIIVASDVDTTNILMTVSCEQPSEDQASSNSTCDLFGVRTIRANVSYWRGQLVLLKSIIYDELQPTYYVNLVVNDGNMTSVPTTVAVTIVPIPTHLSFRPSNAQLNDNVTIKCDFAFPNGFNETKIEIMRAKVPILRYSPETNTSTMLTTNKVIKLENVRYMYSGRHGYITFQITPKTCHKNIFTCQTTDGKGNVHSVTKNVLSDNFPPLVSISRGSCVNLKPDTARLECVGKSKDMDTILKWYLSSDNENYKEMVGVDQINSVSKYDAFKCYYISNSTITFELKGKRWNVKCVMVSTVDNRPTEVAKNVFRVGFEVPPLELKWKRQCTGVKKETVKIVCYGYVGNPPGPIKIYILNDLNVSSYEVSKDYVLGTPKYANQTCMYHNNAEYIHSKNRRSTTKVMCKSQVLIEGKVHYKEITFNIEPRDFCAAKTTGKNQATQQVVHSAFVSVVLFCITFIMSL